MGPSKIILFFSLLSFNQLTISCFSQAPIINQDELIPENFSNLPRSTENTTLGSDDLTNFYTKSACGLDFIQSWLVLGEKMVPYGLPFPNVKQPAELNLVGIPSTATIEKAYAWWDLTGLDTISAITIMNPDSLIDTIPGILLGSGTTKCWSIGAAAFRADVTDLITGDGKYMVSGLQTDSTFTESDVNGLSIIVIFSDPTQEFQGTIRLDNGFQMVRFDTVTHTMADLNIEQNTDFANSFMIISDLQNETGSAIKMNNGPYLNITEDYWDFEEKETILLANQTTSQFGIRAPNDCCNLLVTGLYYQYDTPLITPSFSQNGDTLTSDSAFSYQWFVDGTQINGATNRTLVLDSSGTYSVKTFNDAGCYRISDTMSVIGIDESPHLNNQLLAYPSPYFDHFNVDLPKSTGFKKLYIYNAQGKLVYYKNIKPGSISLTVDLKDISPGLYFIEMNGDNHRYTGRVVKN